MAKSPFKMAGFSGFGNSPLRQEKEVKMSKEAQKIHDADKLKAEGATSYQIDPTVKITPTESDATVKDALIALHTSGPVGQVTGVGKSSRKKVSKYIKSKTKKLVKNVKTKAKKLLKTKLP